MIYKNSNIKLKINDLSVGYSTKTTVEILKGFSAEITQPKLIAVLGKNGSGKTTLLKSITGLLAPLSGDMTFNNHSLSDLTWQQRAQIMASVFTDYEKNHNFDGESIIGMARQNQLHGLGKPNDTDKKAIAQAINLTQIKDISKKPFNTLSDGQRQKIMVAKAIAQDTPLMLLDEPTVHLDINHVMELFLLFRNLVDQHQKAIILTTHEVELALKMANEIWLIDTKKVYTGSTKTMINQGHIAKVFNTEQVVFNAQNQRFNYTFEHKSGK